MLILGIETSCDETSVAVVRDREILSNLIYQQAEHARFGGVVPEVASREHIKKIGFLYKKALREAGVTMKDIDTIAVTQRPGLIGALLVGISFAQGLHIANPHTKLVEVDHLEGHICSLYVNNKIEFPFIALVLSGGHSSIYLVKNYTEYELLGKTVDDAAGEAFDKVGKMLGFEYPAGRKIEEEAKLYKKGGEDFIKFPVAKVRSSGGKPAFSFSGLKTAVRNYIETADLNKERTLICYAFQDAVIRAIIENIKKSLKITRIRRIGICGGVACNQAIRDSILQSFPGHKVYFPEKNLCTDNAAMIAIRAGVQGELSSPCIEPRGGQICL